MSLSPPPCCHPMGFQHSLTLSPTHRISRSCSRGNSQCAGFSTAKQGTGAGLAGGLRGAGQCILACPGYHQSTALLRATCHGSAPTQARTHPWVLLPAPTEGWGCEGLCSPSMMPHLVLRPSTRLPFTWCSWSAPTTAKGIFSCWHRGCAHPGCCSPKSPQGAAGLPDPHPAPQGLFSSIPALTRILSFSALSSGSWSKSSCGYTLMAWVFRSSWICGTQGLSWSSGGHGAAWEPLRDLSSPAA